MPQLVFLHGPGAGGCAEAFRYQFDHFRGSLAPTMLDYPEEVRGLVLMTVAMRPKHRDPGSVDMRLRAAEEPAVYEQWTAMMRQTLRFVAPEFREQLIACHHRVGPRSQHHDLVVIDQFDVRHRISALRPPLLLVLGHAGEVAGNRLTRLWEGGVEVVKPSRM